MPSASRIAWTPSETSGSSLATRTRRLLDHGDVRAQSPENLGELDPDVASTDNRQMTRQSTEFEQGRVGMRANVIDARKIRDHRPSADVDEDPVGLQRFARDLDCVGRNEAGVALDHFAVGHAPEPGIRGQPVYHRPPCSCAPSPLQNRRRPVRQ